MGTKKEILKLRGQLKQLEELDRADDEKELKIAAAKALDRDLTELSVDEIIGDEELKQGNRVGVKSTEILRDSLSDFDPIVGKETLDAEIEKKPAEPGETLHTKGAKDAVTVGISKDILSDFDPLSEG